MVNNLSEEVVNGSCQQMEERRRNFIKRAVVKLKGFIVNKELDTTTGLTGLIRITDGGDDATGEIKLRSYQDNSCYSRMHK